MDPTSYDMMQARAFCSEHGFVNVSAVAQLIAKVRAETHAACGEKALQAVERAWEDGARFARVT